MSGYCSLDRVINYYDGTSVSYHYAHNTLLTSRALCSVSVTAVAPKAAVQGLSGNSVGDPINPASGNVYYAHRDVEGASGAPAFERFYNSTDSNGGDLGTGWRHSFSRSVAQRYSAYSIMPNPGDPQRSYEFTDEATACTSGFAQIKNQRTNWANAVATFDGNVCVLSAGGASIGTLLLLYSKLPLGLPSPTLIGLDVTRDNGQVVTFTLSGGSFVAPPGVALRAQQTSGGGYTVLDENDAVEAYDANGRLLSVTSRAGVVQSVTYDGSGRLSAVTDSFGHQVGFAYNAQGRLSQVTDPASQLVQFGYDGSGRLATVTNADSTTVSYVYENASFPNALTGVIDESGTRYLTWGYDSLGHGNTGSLAGGANSQSLTYNSDGTVTVTDSMGAARIFSFARYGDLSPVSGISGSQCPTCSESKRTTYDAVGYPSSRTDYNNNLTTYAYDDVRGLETSRTEASGTVRARTITTQWDASFRLPDAISVYGGGTATGTPLRTTGFTYDTGGNVLTRTVTDPTANVSRTWTYTYDSYGRVLTVDGPRTDVSDIATYAYYTCSTGAQCGQPQTVTNAAGQVTTFNTYNAYGKPLTLTDPNGILTTLTYDVRQRLISRQVGTETTTFSYWPTGLLKQVTQPDGSYLLYSYDTAHRLTQVSDGPGNTVDYTLDRMGNRTAEYAYDASNTLHRTHTRTFNTLNQLYQDMGSAGTGYVATTYAYDANGNPTSVVAPYARTTTNVYDELNRLKQVTDPGNGITQLGYDANDDLISVTDPRTLVTSYTYNGLGDLTSQVSPDTGSRSNTYDSAGNVATSTDARGAVATYAYDALNRVTSIAYTLGGSTDQTISFTYDAGANGKGHLTGASDAAHTMSWSYDGLGRVTGKTQSVGSVTQSVSYAYTNADLTSITTPSGQTVTYGYNTNHQIVSIAVNGAVVLSGATYEPLGPINHWNWGNGTAMTRTYTKDWNVAQISSAGTKSYYYDYAFRLTRVTDTAPGSANWTYGYDALDRITSGTSPTITRGWSYDANGNRLTETGSAPSTYSISSSSNQITGITGTLARTYAYDASGSTTSYSTVSATYNGAGRLNTLSKGSTTETSLYNALGQRIQVSGGAAGTMLYAYDEAAHLLGEYDGTGGLIQETVWLGDIPVATLRPSGSTVAIYYVHADQLNTPRQVTRPSDNAQMWTWFSDPFGTDAANANPAGMGTFAYNLRLPGQIFDGQAGLHQNGRREFDPAIGKYIESDPIGLTGGINTYAYVGGNPFIYIDPLGLCWIYSQSTGELTKVDVYESGTTTYFAGTGYAGYGAGLNNPAMQDAQNIGPLPQGDYTIGHQQNNVISHGSLPGSMRLTPNPDNQMFNRAGFLIHGPHANDQHNSSNGCPIFTQPIRNQIGDSGDNCLKVLP